MDKQLTSQGLLLTSALGELDDLAVTWSQHAAEFDVVLVDGLALLLERPHVRVQFHERRLRAWRAWNQLWRQLHIGGKRHLKSWDSISALNFNKA